MTAGYPPVSTGTREHFVDADDMERVQPDTDVETVLPTHLHHVLVGTDASGLESWGGKGSRGFKAGPSSPVRTRIEP